MSDELLTDAQLAEIERVMAPPPPVTAQFSPLAREQLLSHGVVQKLLAHVRAQAERIRVMTAGMLDMRAVIASCDDAFSNVQLDEDHVEHIIRDHSESIFDYYRALARDLRPAYEAIAVYNNKLCDEMEARASEREKSP